MTRVMYETWGLLYEIALESEFRTTNDVISGNKMCQNK